MKIYLGLILFFFQSCQNKQDQSVVSNNINTNQKTHVDAILKDAIQFEEFFTDSLNIGRKQFNKVEVSKYRTADSNYVDIKFYTKQTDKWKLKQKLHFWKDGISSCDTKLSDFNNDGLSDMTIVSSTAARGANEIRTLFLFNNERDELTQIKNSSDYPNLHYNEELDCLDAWLVYAGTSTVFLKIEGDSLKEFAGIDLFNDTRTIYEIDKQGNKKILKEENVGEMDVYTRYKNYKPLRVK